jgi:Flp pilus assembly pilin Flp
MTESGNLRTDLPKGEPNWLRGFWSNHCGGEAVEWPIVVAFVLLIAIGAWALFQDSLGNALNAIVNVIESAVD